jgi:hypothetical protein
MIESDTGSPVIGLPVASVGFAVRLNFLNAEIAKPRIEGMSNSFCPHVESRESVNRPPYWYPSGHL